MCVLPVPLLPTAMMFSRRVTYSERASSSTRVLLSDGMAAKSKLSRLFTDGNRASLIRRSTIRRSRSNSDQSGQAQQKADVIEALGGALPGDLVVFAQERRKFERLQVMSEQKLWRIGHDDAPVSRLRYVLAAVIATWAFGRYG